MHRKNKRSKLVFFEFILLIIVAVIVLLSSLVADKNGGHWSSVKVNDIGISDNYGFMMIDVSDVLMVSDSSSETTVKEAYTIQPLTTGNTPSIKNLTDEEIKLYSLLSKNDGIMSTSDKEILNEDMHWQEYVLSDTDTIQSIANRFGIPAKDIEQANLLVSTDKLNAGEVLYIPESISYVEITKSYVSKIKKDEEVERNKTKPISTFNYTVKQGDSLWSIANQYNLNVDTIVGCNSLRNINMLKLGLELRIPNQDGIFVKVTKNVTLSKLADKHGSTLDDVIIANRVDDPKKINVGQEIFLPGGKIVEVVRVENTRRRNVRSNRRSSSSRKRGKTTSHQRLSWPTAGRISSPFGWRRNPFGGKRRRFHSGLDIAAPRGRSILAASGGRVVHSGWMSGYGKTVVIVHSNGMSTLYGHCSSLVVKRGSIVRRGQLIARVGSTGRSTGNHVHFEVRINGRPVNPIKYLR